MNSLEAIASSLDGARRTRSGWQARCPAHDDCNPSLSIEERDGKVLVHCHAGCPQEAVIDALRKLGAWSVASPKNGSVHPRAFRGIAPLREHPYHNEVGDTVFFNCKYDLPKPDNWRPWHKQGNIWAIGGTAPFPYRLTHILESMLDVLIFTEGERDADTLSELGYTATSFKAWKKDWSTYVDRFDTLVAIGDADEPGDTQLSAFDPGQPVIKFSTHAIFVVLGAKGKDVSDLLVAVGADSLRAAVDCVLTDEGVGQSELERNVGYTSRERLARHDQRFAAGGGQTVDAGPAPKRTPYPLPDDNSNIHEIPKPSWRDRLQLTDKGSPKSNLYNTMLAIRGIKLISGSIHWDEFKRRIIIDTPLPWTRTLDKQLNWEERDLMISAL